MNRILIARHFKRQLKVHLKKYRSIVDDLADLLDGFDKRHHADLGRGLYKARLKSGDVPRGKNKSFRVVVFVVEVEKLLAPVAIYFKGDRNDMSKKELNDHLEAVLFELRCEGVYSQKKKGS